MINNKLEGFKKYWKRENDTFLVALCPGNYLISKRYTAAYGFLDKPREVSPGDFDPEAFRADYQHIFTNYEAAEHDGVFTAVPFVGLPWMEALAGCRIMSTPSSFVAENHRPVDGKQLSEGFDEHWLDLFLRFTKMLCEMAGDRFAVGQPIMRGPCDLAGTLLGQKEMVYYFYDDPDTIIGLIEGYEGFFLDIMRRQKKLIPSFHGGYSIGFYDLWCPGECIWFQDDLTSLLSPSLYEQYVLPVHSRLASSYEYSLIHLHPASFFILDYLLDIPQLKCIQVNKDIGGPSVKEMLPYLSRIQNTKNLVISGDFTDEELELLHSGLSPQGVYLIRIDSPD